MSTSSLGISLCQITFRLLIAFVVIQVILYELRPTFDNFELLRPFIEPRHLRLKFRKRHMFHSMLESQKKLHANFMQRGRDFAISQREAELTLKYWELDIWIKNFPNSSGTLPSPYKFENDSVLHTAAGALDKILAQQVWRMQLIIGNYAHKYLQRSNATEPYAIHTYTIKPKRIFVGDVDRLWLDWTMLPEWRDTGRISHCEQFAPLLKPLADSEPACELVRRLPPNTSWTGIDLITSFQSNDPPEARKASPPRGLPWLKFTLESPWYLPIRNSRRGQFMNSYWSGSLVQHKYAKWVYYDPHVREQEQQRDYSAEKAKSVAMLVSNCRNSHNGRLVYARELQKHIDVDIYGKCGNLECGGVDEQNRNRSCFEVLREYKFYLAFENSNCQDYVTEKLHLNALSNGIVPIVMGAPPSFYLQHAPQNSYIHVQDFPSPQALAIYLQALAANSNMYNAYFRWRGTGGFLLPRKPWLCDACALLYSSSDVSRLRLRRGKKRATQWMPGFKVKGQPLCLPEGRWYW